MSQDDKKADDLIPGSLKHSKSYHAEYGNYTLEQLKDMASRKPKDKKAAQMYKLIRDEARLRQQNKGRRS